jgi:hypothetical protein
MAPPIDPPADNWQYLNRMLQFMTEGMAFDVLVKTLKHGAILADVELLQLAQIFHHAQSVTKNNTIR